MPNTELNCKLVAHNTFIYLVFESEEKTEDASKTLNALGIDWKQITSFNGYFNAIKLN